MERYFSFILANASSQTAYVKTQNFFSFFSSKAGKKQPVLEMDGVRGVIFSCILM